MKDAYPFRSRLHDLVHTPKGHRILAGFGAGAVAIAVALTTQGSTSSSGAAQKEAAAATARTYDQYKNTSVGIARTILEDYEHGNSSAGVNTGGIANNSVSIQISSGDQEIEVEFGISTANQNKIYDESPSNAKYAANYLNFLEHSSAYTVQELETMNLSNGDTRSLTYFGDNNWAVETGSMPTCADDQGVTLADGESYYQSCSPSDIAGALGNIAATSESILQRV